MEKSRRVNGTDRSKVVWYAIVPDKKLNQNCLNEAIETPGQTWFLPLGHGLSGDVTPEATRAIIEQVPGISEIIRIQL